MSDTVRAQRRAEIVDAARLLVAQGGMEALTISKLERSISFTRGVITYHFENKDEIVDAVLSSALDEIDSATLQSWDPTATLHEQVSAVLGTKIRGFLEHPEASRILLAFWVRPASDPYSQHVNRRLFRTYRRQAAGLVEASGADVDIPAMAALLVGTVIGVVMQIQLDPDRVDADAVIAEAATALGARLSTRRGAGRPLVR